MSHHDMYRRPATTPVPSADRPSVDDDQPTTEIVLPARTGEPAEVLRLTPAAGTTDAGTIIEVAGVPVTGEAPSRARWSRGARLLTAAVALVLLLGVAAVAATLTDPNPAGVTFSGAGHPATGAHAGEDGPGGVNVAQSGPAGVLTAPLDGRRRATFELVDGLATLSLRTADLGDDLYRIGSPAGSGVDPAPRVLGDQVRLHVQRGTRPGPGVVDVALNSRVDWRLQITGGVDEQVLDLSGGRSAGVDLLGGATRVDLRLPRVTGTLPVRMTGGVNELLIRAAGDPPARVRAASGAGTIRVYDQRQAGIAAGAVVSSPHWDTVADRIWVDLVAGANAVTVGAS
ncbi:hypothetical protein [Micromonospora fluostatini]|uniref:hypothetical protein n=1 Tax=Micromonospora sp. JCM 30529 TaxID=3421643 RepID=UPI003D174138